VAKKIDALVVAGVHIMDGMLSKELRSARLLQIKQVLHDFPKTRLHLEMGSTGDTDFSEEIVTSLAVDSIGLNEQEFFALCESLKIIKAEDKVSLASSTPPVLKIQSAISAVFQRFERLSRLHFHCFSYHLIAQKETGVMWPNPREAVAMGSVTATTRACVTSVQELHGSKLSLSVTGVKLLTDNGETRTIDISPENPVAEFSYKGAKFYLAPVVACTTPKQTVGLGDFISASALAMQL